MSFNLSSFAENIFRARDTVLREPVGFIQNVQVNSDTAAVSINGAVNSLQTALPTVNTSVTPSMTIPEGDNQTVANVQLVLNKTANVRIPLVGEDVRKLENVGSYQSTVDDMFKQAIRGLVNEIERNIGLEAYVNASRATGTVAASLFGSNFNVIADARQIVVDNGAGDSDLRAVINTLSGTKLRQLANIFQANVAGSDATVRSGRLLDLYGVGIAETSGIAAHTAGAGTGYLVNAGGGLAAGTTTIPVDGGTVNTTGIKAGDVITFAADADNKYVVKTGLTAASGSIVIHGPGLRKTIPNDNAITIGATFSGNVLFKSQAIELAMRPPAMPIGGDSASEVMTIADDVSGLVFQAALYKGYQKNMIDLTAVYGVKAWKPEAIALMLG
jgi:hypothetical protein